MGRSTWKFLPIIENDIKLFFSKIDEEYWVKPHNGRNKTLNLLNNRREYKIHQGCSSTTVKVNRFAIGLKLGMFSKTRKPYFFRSKKKKR